MSCQPFIPSTHAWGLQPWEAQDNSRMVVFRLPSLAAQRHPEQRQAGHEAEAEHRPGCPPDVAAGRLASEMREQEARRDDARERRKGEPPGVQAAEPGGVAD